MTTERKFKEISRLLVQLRRDFAAANDVTGLSEIITKTALMQVEIATISRLWAEARRGEVVL